MNIPIDVLKKAIAEAEEKLGTGIDFAGWDDGSISVNRDGVTLAYIDEDGITYY